MRVGNGDSYLGDTIEVMDDLIDNGTKVNYIMTSPPYNMNGHEKEYYASAVGNDSFRDNKTPEEYNQWIIDIFNRYDQLLETNGIVLFNLNYMSSRKNRAINTFKLITLIEENTSFTLIDQIAWKKSNAGLLTNGTRLSRIFENIWVFIRDKDWDSFNDVFYKRLFGKLNWVEAPNNDGTNELNKACFSSSLVVQLLQMYDVKPTDVVLDNFMGTHTTAIACEKVGCKWVGIEIDKETQVYGLDRVRNHVGDFEEVEKYGGDNLFTMLGEEND